MPRTARRYNIGYLDSLKERFHIQTMIREGKIHPYNPLEDEEPLVVNPVFIAPRGLDVVERLVVDYSPSNNLYV